MKRLMLSVITLVAAVSASAQINPIENLPTKKGETIVNKCYDAEGNLRATMTYEIANFIDNGTDTTLEVKFTMTDPNNEVIDYGTVLADYEGGQLNLRMSNRPEIKGIDGYLSLNTKLMDDFTNFPDPDYADNGPANTGPFAMDAVEYTIERGKKRSDFIEVKVVGRNYEGKEKVTTPAGEFDASKVTFTLEVFDNSNKSRETYRGTEWHSPGVGIVRTEITDREGNMVDYSEINKIYSRM